MKLKFKCWSENVEAVFFISVPFDHKTDILQLVAYKNIYFVLKKNYSLDKNIFHQALGLNSKECVK